jgi:hypothetical protein
MTITKEVEKVQESICDWTSDKPRKYRPNLRVIEQTLVVHDRSQHGLIGSNVFNAKHIQFILSSLTGIVITFAIGFVLLQVSVRYGLSVTDFSELTLY